MNFKQIASFDNYLLANMSLGMLQENSINCHLKDENIVTIDPLLSPAVGGIKLFVEEQDYVKAIDIIKEAETTYLKEISSPHCHSNSLVTEEKINNPENFWGKLKNQVLYGQESTYSKFYRCQNCNHSFTELPVTY